MILEIIVVTIFIATIFNIILHKFHMPTIIGYILTGTSVAYIFGLHELASSEQLKIIGEFGIVFLMFTIGLEFSFKKLIKMKRNVFFYGSLQFFITTLIFYLLAIFVFSLNSSQGVIVSLGLALSSTAIVLKLLNESGEINKHYGNKALGILLFQDIMVIPILLLITVLSVNDTNIGLLLTQTLFSAVILIIILYIIGKYLLDYFLLKAAKTKSNEIFIGSILFLIIGASALAHKFGFSYSLGAFIAGMLIAETHYKHQVEADLIPFRDLLLGFFFVTVGMQLNFEIIGQNIGVILGLLILLTLIKVLVIMFISVWSENKKSTLKTAISLFQFGEFGIVIFELATIKELLTHDVSQVLIVVIIISMILTPLVLKNISDISNFLLGYKHSEKNGYLMNKNLKDHVILIGYGRLGKILSCMLDNTNTEYVILESYIKAYKEGKKEGKPIIFGNAFQTNTLKSINISEAKTVLISVGKSDKLFLVAEVIKKLNIKGNIIVKVNSYEEEKMLEKLDINKIIVETEKTASGMIEAIRN